VRRRGAGGAGQAGAKGGAHAADPAAARPRGRVWALGLALLLTATLGAYLLGRLAAHALLLPASLSRAGVSAAPDLVGRELEDARSEAQDAGAGLDVLGVAYAAEVDSGKVLSQYPAEGLPLEPGKPVEVIVSAGPGTRRMPDLQGLPESDARTLLAQLGAEAPRVEAEAEPGVAQGTVVSTRPPADASLAPGDSVVLSVSRGETIVEVPNLRGKSLEEAAAILQEAQLRAGETAFDEGSESAEALVVVGQEPPAGGLAASGSAVNLRLGRSRESVEE
jgi:serine/threonine-protein kinase